MPTIEKMWIILIVSIQVLFLAELKFTVSVNNPLSKKEDVLFKLEKVLNDELIFSIREGLACEINLKVYIQQIFPQYEKWDPSLSSQVTFLSASNSEQNRGLLRIEQTGILKIPELDREDQTLCIPNPDCIIESSAVVVLRENAENAKRILVKIKVNDTNDNKVSFLEPVLKLTILEDLKIDEVISQDIPFAIDPDSRENSVSQYQLLSEFQVFDTKNNSWRKGLEKEHSFVLYVPQSFIPPNKLKLRTQKEIDREIISDYKYILRASEGAAPFSYADLELLIEVLDVNDNSPKFLYHVRTLEVNESMLVGSDLEDIVTAVDFDSGPNGKIVYSVVKDTCRNFAIDSESGKIHLIQPLDYSKTTNCTLEVEASDRGIRSLSDLMTIHIIVHDENNYDPELTLECNTGQKFERNNYLFKNTYFKEVKENQATQNSKLLCWLIINDRDSELYSNIHCEMNPVIESTRYFQLEKMPDKNSIWKLNTKQALDREEKANHELRIICIDNWDKNGAGIQKTSTATLSIIVTG